MIRVLTIAASDPSGGAGIEADLKVFSAHGGYGLTALTAVTLQDTAGVHGVEATPVAAFRRCLELLAADRPIAAVKIGALASRDHLVAAADFLAALAPRPPVVLDPVLVSTSGRMLFPPDGIELLRRLLLPLVTLVTPNLPEAELLTGKPVRTEDDMIAAAATLVGMGAAAALVKGGHLAGTPKDVLVRAGDREIFTGKRRPREYHGTGCALSSAVAARLARGEGLVDAVTGGRGYLGLCMDAAEPGKGKSWVLGFPRAPDFG